MKDFFIGLSLVAVIVVVSVVVFEIVKKHPTSGISTETRLDTSDVPVLAKSEVLLNAKKVLNLELSDEQIIVLVGPIMENAADIVNEINNKAANKKPLYLLINSPGGSVLDGALIMSAMESARVPVNTVCMQLCASMAAIIHQHGTKRYMLDRSILMFHDAAGGFQGYMPHMRAQLDMIDRYVAKFNYYIAKRSGQDPEAFITEVHKNIWVDGEDAVAKKYSDGLAFIKVLSKSGPSDMNALLKPTKTITVPFPKTNIVPESPVVNPFYDVKL